MQATRHLAAILFTDIVGSTALMQMNEQAAVLISKRYMAVLKTSVLSHGGEVLNDFGDGSLCSFSSATEALHCAMEMQQAFRQEPKVPLRIGLHVGEIFFEDGKVLGDGVNVASRVQSLGIANSVLFSSEICSKIKNQPEFKSVSIGKFHFKNVDEPMEVFALSNEGLMVPQKKQMAGKLHEEKRNRNRIIWMTAVLLLVIIGFVVYRQNFKSSGFIGEKSIAVLPFENIGPKDSEEYVSDGITQDVINKLSKISSLEKVIAWFSVRGFKNTNKSVKQIADELGVAAILSGTIERNAGNIHIITELIDVHTNKRLWGEDYNYNNKNILSIQTNLATHIANALRTHLTSEETKNLSRNYTENVDAYKLYRRGRSFWDQRTKASYDSAEVYYKKAIELDPDYALAYSGLADCYTYNQKGLSQTEAIPIAHDYAMKALSLDSTLIEAWTTIAFIKSYYEFNWKDANALFEKIIRINPNYPVAHMYYGNILLNIGKTDEGIYETKKALSLDPLSAVINYVLGRQYLYARRYDSAVGQLQKSLVLNPKFIQVYVPLGNSYVQLKLYSRAVEAYSKLPKVPFDLGNNGLLLLSYAYANSGDSATAKVLLKQVPERDVLQCPYLTACVYVALGDFDNAFPLFDEAYAIHAIQLIFLKVDPLVDPVRNDPRFKALMKKMQLN